MSILASFISRIDVVLRENQRGLLYEDGKLVRWLEAGRHRISKRRTELVVETIDLDETVYPFAPEIDAIAPPTSRTLADVAAHEVAIVIKDQKPIACLEAGRHILWTERGEVSFDTYDCRDILVELPELHAQLVPEAFIERHTVNDDELGLLEIDGKLRHCLEPGGHWVWRRERKVAVRRLDLDAGYVELTPELEAVLPKDAYTMLDVPEDHLAVVTTKGVPQGAVGPGRYALWQRRRKVEGRIFATNVLASTIPEKLRRVIDPAQLLQVTVSATERGILVVDGKVEEALEPGRYAFHLADHEVVVHAIDLREAEVQVVGQEVMTEDKVSLRINIVAKYCIRDPRRVLETLQNVHDALYTEAQMAARHYVGGVKIDELLEGRTEAASVMAERMAARTAAWGIEVVKIDLKDIILPGEMKTLLNQVIEAEKKAAANLILRREETAATRSLANTAKVMQNNPLLARLKELEVFKEIASRVGKVTVVAGTDQVLSQLRLVSPEE